MESNSGELIPSQEKIDHSPQWRSSYNPVALKKAANEQAIKLLIKGTPLDTDNFRSYIEQGMLDPAITDPKKIFFLMTHGKDKRFFKAGNRSLGMGVNYSHWMDPGRWPDKWVRGIDRYEKSVNAQI